jgi:hypothetical protein
VITFNPIYAVELEPETREAPLVWEPEQVAHFLAHTADDRLYFLCRLALVRGFRRGELAGMADEDLNLDDGAITVVTVAPLEALAVSGWRVAGAAVRRR